MESGLGVRGDKHVKVWGKRRYAGAMEIPIESIDDYYETATWSHKMTQEELNMLAAKWKPQRNIVYGLQMVDIQFFETPKYLKYKFGRHDRIVCFRTSEYCAGPGSGTRPLTCTSWVQQNKAAEPDHQVQVDRGAAPAPPRSIARQPQRPPRGRSPGNKRSCIARQPRHRQPAPRANQDGDARHRQGECGRTARQMRF